MIVGMPKNAVLISYGYPPEHATPSLDTNVWRYWVNKMKSKNICFDSEDKAISCKDLQKNEL